MTIEDIIELAHELVAQITVLDERAWQKSGPYWTEDIFTLHVLTVFTVPDRLEKAIDRYVETGLWPEELEIQELLDLRRRMMGAAVFLACGVMMLDEKQSYEAPPIGQKAIGQVILEPLLGPGSAGKQRSGELLKLNLPHSDFSKLDADRRSALRYFLVDLWNEIHETLLDDVATIALEDRGKTETQ